MFAPVSLASSKSCGQCDRELLYERGAFNIMLVNKMKKAKSVEIENSLSELVRKI